MTKRLRVLLIILGLSSATVTLQAQTVTTVLSQTQQDFIKALCLTLLNDANTPGNVLAPGLTADRFCDARVTDAFMIANWDSLVREHNNLVSIAINHESRITTVEAAATVDVVALEARVVSLETQVADLSTPPSPPPPPPTSFENLIIRNGDLGTVGTGYGFLSSNRGGLGIVAADQTFGADQYSEGVVSADRPRGAHFGLFVRRNQLSGQRYNCVWGLPTSANPNGFFLLKLDGLAGAPTLARVPATQVPVGGDKLRIEARGSVISCLFNDAEIITVSNSALSSGELGMVMSLASQAEIPVPPSALPFPIFESWSGGNL